MKRSAAFFRRRQYIIKKRLQYGLLFTAFSYILIVILVIAFSLFLPLVLSMEKAGSSADLAARFMLYLHENLWPPLFLTLLAIAFHSIMISHRIAGPLYRITVFFREVFRGMIPRPIVLRKDDYLSNEVREINKAFDILRSHFMEIREAGEDLRHHVEDSTPGLIASCPKDAVETLNRITEKTRSLEEKIASIRIMD